MIKMRVGEAVDLISSQEFRQLIRNKDYFDYEQSFLLMCIIEEVRKKAEFFHKTVQEKREELAEKDENGKPITKKIGDREIFELGNNESELNEFFIKTREAEFEINLSKVPVKVQKDSKTHPSIQEMMMLNHFVDWEVEEAPREPKRSVKKKR